MKKEIKVGATFGKWKVVRKDESKRNDAHIYWICQCQCGNIKSVRSTNLRSGKSISCGCVNNFLYVPNKNCSPKILDITN